MPLATFLQELGHDAIHAVDIGAARAADSALRLKARAESRVVITADLAFGRLMAEVPEKSPGIILLRGGSYSDKEMIQLVQRVLRSVEQELLAASLVVIDRHRIRRRQLPIIGRRPRHIPTASAGGFLSNEKKPRAEARGPAVPFSRAIYTGRMAGIGGRASVIA